MCGILTAGKDLSARTRDVLRNLTHVIPPPVDLEQSVLLPAQAMLFAVVNPVLFLIRILYPGVSRSVSGIRIVVRVMFVRIRNVLRSQESYKVVMIALLQTKF